jgi:hypothetical protein
MMDQVFKTHKENTFGWVLLIQELAAAHAARKARRQAARRGQAAPRSVRKPMRYLTLR